MPPEASLVREFLARVARRMAWLSAGEGATAGLAVAIVLAALGWPRRDAVAGLVAAGVAAGAIGILISVFISADRRDRVALHLEGRVPASRNLIVTASELLARPEDGYTHRLVLGEAARLVSRLDPAALFPARRALIMVSGALAVWLLVLARPLLPIPAALGGARAAEATDGIPTLEKIDVTIEPPAYTRRAKQTLSDPSRIEALVGSRITLSVRARAAHVGIETLSSRDSLTRRGGSFAGSLVADADGYVAVEPATGARTGARRLIGLTVIPDAPPRVRIAAPGRDQRFPDGHRVLDVAIEASDDIGLASLELRFTKVSGSGERFTFVERQAPLAITRHDELSWTARAALNLDSLALEPGDMVVYRALAADRQPKGGTTESDAFIAEILAPGGVAAPGFAVDPEQDRYAVSEQMVILKTERLLARRATMSEDSVAIASQEIAAEQRKVRAEFVFTLGGELEDAADVAASMTDIDETKEAEGEQDLLSGRNANAGHIALLRAIRAMSRAAASLAVGEPTTALPYEHTALIQLESVFSRSRVLLRALTTRERIDLSRRLTGVLTDAGRDIQPSAQPESAVRTVALRRVLSDIAALAGSKQFGPASSARASSAAEQVLRIDPSSRDLQDVAAQLALAATNMGDGRDEAARAALDRASAGVVATLRTDLTRRANWTAEHERPADEWRAGGCTPCEKAAVNVTLVGRALRGVAVAIAIVAIIDPAILVSRPIKPVVVVVALDSARDAALADHVANTVTREFLVSRTPIAGASASVIVGDRLPSARDDYPPPTFAVVADTATPSVSIERVDVPANVPPDARVPVMVQVAVHGFVGRLLDVSLRAGSSAVDRTSVRFTTSDSTLIIPLSFVPSSAGAIPVRVTATMNGASSPAIADEATNVRERRWAVCFSIRGPRGRRHSCGGRSSAIPGSSSRAES